MADVRPPVPAQVMQLIHASGAAAGAQVTWPSLGALDRLRQWSASWFQLHQVQHPHAAEDVPMDVPAAAPVLNLPPQRFHARFAFPSASPAPPSPVSLTRRDGQMQRLLRQLVLPHPEDIPATLPDEQVVLRLPLGARLALRWLQTCVDRHITVTAIARSLDLASQWVWLAHMAALLDPSLQQLKERAARLDHSHAMRSVWLSADDAPPDLTGTAATVSAASLPLALRWVREASGRADLLPADLERARFALSLRDAGDCPKQARLLALALAAPAPSQRAQKRREREMGQLVAGAACRCP